MFIRVSFCLFLLCTILASSQSLPYQQQAKLSITGRNFMYSIGNDFIPGDGAENITDVVMYDENIAMISFATSNRLGIYKKPQNSIKGGYQIINLIDRGGQDGGLYGLTPSNNFIQSIDLYAKNNYQADNLDPHYVHGVFVTREYSLASSRKLARSYIHHFTLDTSLGDIGYNNLYFGGDKDGTIANYNYRQLETNTQSINDAVMTRVVYNANNSSVAGTQGIFHTLWACGDKVIKFFNGEVWVDYANTSSAPSNKSYNKAEYNAIANLKSNEIKNEPNIDVVQYNAIQYFKNAAGDHIIFVGGNNGSIVKITQKVADFTNDITGNANIVFENLKGTGLSTSDNISTLFLKNETEGWIGTQDGKIYTFIFNETNNTLTVTKQYDNGSAFQINKIHGSVERGFYAVGDLSGLDVSVLKYNSNTLSWDIYKPFNKLFSTYIAQKPSFSAISFYKGVGMVVGTESAGYLLLGSDNTKFRFYESTVPDANLLPNVYLADKTIGWRPNSKSDISMISDGRWMVDTSSFLSPFLSTNSIINYYRPECLIKRDNDEDYNDGPNQSCEGVTNNITFTSQPLPPHAPYGDLSKYYQSLGSRKPGVTVPSIKSTNVIPYVSQFAALGKLSPPPNITPQSFKLSFRTLNYNYSLDENIISLTAYSLEHDSIVLKIKQSSFVPWIAPFNFSNTNNDNFSYFIDKENNALAGSKDTLKTSVIGAFKIEFEKPSNYYKVIEIDKILGKSIDTPILRKAKLDNDITDTVVIASQYNFINSAPGNFYDIAYIIQTGPCKNDGTGCPIESKDTVKASILKTPLIVSVKNARLRGLNTTATPPNPPPPPPTRETTFDKQYGNAKTFDRSSPRYDDYTNEILDEIAFCQDGKLKNKDGNCITGRVQDSIWYTSINAPIGMKYNVVTKLFNYQQGNIDATLPIHRGSRYQLQILSDTLIHPNSANPKPYIRPILVNGVFTQDQPAFYPNELKTTACMNADTLISKVVCDTTRLGPTEFSFFVRADSINRLPIPRIDTVAMVVEGYDNATLPDGSKDKSIKSRTIKLIKIIQDAALVHLMYQARPNVTANNDSVDNRLNDNRADDSLLFTGDVLKTNIDSFYVRSNTRWVIKGYRRATNNIDTTLLPTWIDTTKHGRLYNAFDSGIMDLPYKKVVIGVREGNPQLNDRVDSIRLCVEEGPLDACKRIIVTQKPSFLTIYVSDSSLVDPNILYPLQTIRGTYNMDTARKVKNYKFQNLSAKVNPQFKNLDTAEVMQMYVLTNSPWELRILDPLPAPVQTTPPTPVPTPRIFLDTVDFYSKNQQYKNYAIQIRDANGNVTGTRTGITDSGSRYIKFVTIDSNHTFKDWAQQIEICNLTSGYCDTATAFIKGVKSLMASTLELGNKITNCGVLADNQECINGITTTQKISFANGGYDSVRIAIDTSFNYWNIRFDFGTDPNTGVANPVWLERDIAKEIEKGVDTGTKTIILKTLDSNYSSAFKGQGTNMIVCKTFNNTLNNYPTKNSPNKKDSACIFYPLIQDTSYIRMPDTVFFLASKGATTTAEVNTESYYEFKTLPAQARIPQGTIGSPTDPEDGTNRFDTSSNFKIIYNKIKNSKYVNSNPLPQYLNNLYGNSRVTFQTLEANKTIHDTIGYMQVCLKLGPTLDVKEAKCQNVVLFQNKPILKISYIGASDILKKRMQYNFQRSQLDSVQVQADFELDFYSGTQIVGSTPSQYPTVTPPAPNPGVDITSNIHLHNFDTVMNADGTVKVGYFIYRFSTLKRHVPNNKPHLKNLDSFTVCFRGAQVGCEVVRVMQDTPLIATAIYQNNHHDSLYFLHHQYDAVSRDSIKDSLVVSADGEWKWKTLPNILDTLPHPEKLPDSGYKKVVFITKQRNIKNTVNTGTMEVCILKDETDITSYSDFCAFADYLQDTAKLNVKLISLLSIDSNKLLFGFGKGQKDSVYVEANDDFEISCMGSCPTGWVGLVNKGVTPLDEKADTGNYVFDMRTVNTGRIDKEDTLKFTIKGTSVFKNIIAKQEAAYLRVVPDTIFLKRRINSEPSNLVINSNTGWNIISKINKYNIKEIGGDMNAYSYGQTIPWSNENNYDSLKSILAVNPQKSNDQYVRFTDSLIITSKDETGFVIQDTVILVQDSIYLNFVFEHNAIGYPYINEADSVITVGPEENTQFISTLIGNVDWEPFNYKWQNLDHWNKWEPIILQGDTNNLIVRAFTNNNPELLAPRLDTIHIRTANLSSSIQNKTLFKIKLLQDPFIVPIEENYLIFPVPVRDILTIRSKNYIADYTGRVYIYSMDGNLIATKEFVNGIINFDFSALNTGLYILKIYDGNIYYKKIILKQ